LATGTQRWIEARAEPYALGGFFAYADKKQILRFSTPATKTRRRGGEGRMTTLPELGFAIPAISVSQVSMMKKRKRTL
jgi:hypothetical protein